MSATATEYAKVDCQHCGGSIEIPRDYIGAEHECPHCHKTTRLDEKPEPPPLAKPPKREAIFELPSDYPVTPARIRRAGPPSYTAVAVFGFIIGLGMIVGCFTEMDSKTVFQQIAGRLLGIGGVAVCGLAVLVEALSPVLRFLWELSLRLESIEERLARMNRKL